MLCMFFRKDVDKKLTCASTTHQAYNIREQIHRDWASSVLLGWCRVLFLQDAVANRRQFCES